MLPEYPGAIVWPAHPTNVLGPPCTPKGWVLHTPEEPADDYPGTPYYFAKPNKQASTHYFVSYLGFVWQMVEESVAPIANGVLGKPYPPWADPSRSLNRQTLSVEIEGYAATIGQTISQAQRKALLDLLAYGCRAYSIPRDRQHIIGHYEVATNRTDPGTLDIDGLVQELQEVKVAQVKLVQIKGQPPIYAVVGGLKIQVPNPAVFSALGYRWEEVEVIPADHPLAKLPTFS